MVSIREHGSDRDRLASLEALVAGFTPNVRLTVDTGNPGFGAGCNALARDSAADWLLFLNPDAVIVAWPWGPDRSPPTGQITGPEMVGNGATERHSGRSYRIRDEIARSWLRRSGKRPDGRGFVSGAALLIDRVSFERVGGFDPSYFMFYEDIDLCLRANDLGVGTQLEGDWIVRHQGAHSTRSRLGEAVMWSYESACRFHQARDSSLVTYRAYVVLDSLLRAAVRASRRDCAGCRGYLRLSRRAALDLVGRRRTR